MNIFDECESLRKVVFHPDSNLEKIESPFNRSAIRHLPLPHSVRKIVDANIYMSELDSMHVSNSFFQSNEE